MVVENDRSAAHHSVLFLACALVVFFLPQFVRVWPFPLLVTILTYLFTVSAITHFRRSFRPPTLGGRRCSSWLFAAVVAVATSGVLFWFQHSRQPDLQYLYDGLPIDELGWIPVALLFPPVNAVLEKCIFRLILFDGVRAIRGVVAAVVGTSVLFGLGHMVGYPPGVFGGLTGRTA